MADNTTIDKLLAVRSELREMREASPADVDLIDAEYHVENALEALRRLLERMRDG